MRGDLANALARRSQTVRLGVRAGKSYRKAEGPLRSGPSREKSFWANARMALETLPQLGVYETWFAESRAKTVETFGE